MSKAEISLHFLGTSNCIMKEGLEHYLRLETGWQGVNASLGACTSAIGKLNHRILPPCEGATSFVIVDYHINDAQASLRGLAKREVLLQNLREIIHHLREGGHIPILLTLPLQETLLAPCRLEQETRLLAQELGVFHWNIAEVLRNQIRGGAPFTSLMRDYTHLSPASCEAVARHLAMALQRINQSPSLLSSSEQILHEIRYIEARNLCPDRPFVTTQSRLGALNVIEIALGDKIHLPLSEEEELIGLRIDSGAKGAVVNLSNGKDHVAKELILYWFADKPDNFLILLVDLFTPLRGGPEGITLEIMPADFPTTEGMLHSRPALPGRYGTIKLDGFLVQKHQPQKRQSPIRIFNDLALDLAQWPEISSIGFSLDQLREGTRAPKIALLTSAKTAKTLKADYPEQVVYELTGHSGRALFTQPLQKVLQDITKSAADVVILDFGDEDQDVMAKVGHILPFSAENEAELLDRRYERQAPFTAQSLARSKLAWTKIFTALATSFSVPNVLILIPPRAADRSNVSEIERHFEIHVADLRNKAKLMLPQAQIIDQRSDPALLNTLLAARRRRPPTEGAKAKALIFGNYHGLGFQRALKSSPSFQKAYDLVELSWFPKFDETELKAWQNEHAAKTELFIGQIHGAKGQSNHHLAPAALRQALPANAISVNWRAIPYQGYEPYLVKIKHAPRQRLGDLVNLLHLAAHREGIAWQKVYEFYLDATAIAQNVVQTTHARAIETYRLSERDCDLKMADFIASHWSQQRLYIAPLFPAGAFYGTSANRLLAKLGLAEDAAELQLPIIPLDLQMPLLAAFDAAMDHPQSAISAFPLAGTKVTHERYFTQWAAEFDLWGKELMTQELEFQLAQDPVIRVFLSHAALRLGLKHLEGSRS